MIPVFVLPVVHVLLAGFQALSAAQVGADLDLWDPGRPGILRDPIRRFDLILLDFSRGYNGFLYGRSVPKLYVN
jgi:hypothetical protein